MLSKGAHPYSHVRGHVHTGGCEFLSRRIMEAIHNPGGVDGAERIAAIIDALYSWLAGAENNKVKLIPVITIINYSL